MPASFTGPRIEPRSGKAKQLVVFLHGFGADGNDLIEIGRQWQRFLPDAGFVAPHAPEPCISGGAGRQWFPLTFRDPHERWRGVNHAAPGLEVLLDEELARHGVPPQKLALVGFSQGTMMALHVALRRPQSVAAVVGYSGLLVLEEGRGPESSRPGALEAADPARPRRPRRCHSGRRGAAEIPVEWHLSAGIAHGIDAEGLRQGALFLARAFGLPTPKS